MASLHFPCISILVLGQIFATVHGIVFLAKSFQDIPRDFIYPCAPKLEQEYRKAISGIDYYSYTDIKDIAGWMLSNDLYPSTLLEMGTFLCVMKKMGMIDSSTTSTIKFNEKQYEQAVKAFTKETTKETDFPLKMYLEDMNCHKKDDFTNEASLEKASFLLYRCIRLREYFWNVLEPSTHQAMRTVVAEATRKICRTPYGEIFPEQNQEYAICYMTRRGLLQDGDIHWDMYVMFREQEGEYDLWMRKLIEIVGETCNSIRKDVYGKEIGVMALEAYNCITEKEEEVAKEVRAVKSIANGRISSDEVFSIIFQRIVPKDSKGKEFLFEFQLAAGIAPQPIQERKVDFKYLEYVNIIPTNWDSTGLQNILPKNGLIDSPDAAVHLHENILKYQKSKIPPDGVKEWVEKRNTFVMNLCADISKVSRAIAPHLLGDLYPINHQEKCFYDCIHSKSGLIDVNGRFKWKEYWARMVADGADEMPYGSPDLSCQHVEENEVEKCDRALKTFKCNRRQSESSDSVQWRVRAGQTAFNFSKGYEYDDIDSRSVGSERRHLAIAANNHRFMRRLGLQENWTILWDNYVSYADKLDLWERKEVYFIRDKCEQVLEKIKKINEARRGHDALECIANYKETYQMFFTAPAQSALENMTKFNQDEAFRIVSYRELPTTDDGKEFLEKYLLNILKSSGKDWRNAPNKIALVRMYDSWQQYDEPLLNAFERKVTENCIEGKDSLAFFECVSKENLKLLPEVKEKSLKEQEILFVRYCADMNKVPREIAEALILYDLFPLTSQEKAIYQCYLSKRGFLAEGRFKWNEYKEYISRRCVSERTPIQRLLKNTKIQEQYDADMPELDKAFGSFKALTSQIYNKNCLDKRRKIKEKTYATAVELCDWGSEQTGDEVCPVHCLSVRLGFVPQDFSFSKSKLFETLSSSSFSTEDFHNYGLKMKDCAQVLNEYSSTAPEELSRRCKLAYEFLKCVHEIVQWNNERLSLGYF